MKATVWCLHKALYGLNQAANVWHAKLSEELRKFGFKPCITDACLFVKFEGDCRIHLLVYVDDMLIGGLYADVLDTKHIHKCSQRSWHCVPFSWFSDPSRQVWHQAHSRVIHQSTVLEWFRYEYAYPKRSPFKQGTAKECAVRCQCDSAEKKKTHLRDEPALECTCAAYESEIDFGAFVGAVMFLATCSRPEIAYSLGRFVNDLKAFHEPLVKHLLRYLKRTIDWGVWYPSRRYLQECSPKIPGNMHLYTVSDHSGEEK